MAREEPPKETRLALIRRCDDLNVDLQDALDTEVFSWQPTDPPSILLAVNAHLEVLARGTEILAMAKQAKDPTSLYDAAAGLALMEKLSPWPVDTIVEIRSDVVSTERLGINPDIVEHYRLWLASDIEGSIPKASLTAAAALAISCALAPPDAE